MKDLWRRFSETEKAEEKEPSLVPQWALDAIQTVREEGLSNLDLRGTNHKQKLSRVPDIIADLTNLRELDLSDNQLIAFPDAILRLTSLEKLNLNTNHLLTVPVTLARLSNLIILDLSINRIKVIPDEIVNLQNLQKLYLRSNLLEDFSLGNLPNNSVPFRNLQLLDLSYNPLEVVPDTLKQLTNLQELHLSGSQIKIIPRWLAQLPSLEKLYLGENPIKLPPPEIIDLGYSPVAIDLQALKAYFRQQIEKGEEALYEAKLLIVGEPGAGKTSLTRKLVDPSASLPAKDESTEGIDVHTWTFPFPENQTIEVLQPSKTPLPDFRVNIWDFGGQEIYHATHQFFLTRRSLYVVVADAREQKTDFFHWLDLIEHLSNRSPVLIFNNAFQNRHWAINEQQLQAHFPDTFHKPFAFDLANDQVGLAYLRQKIQEHITQLPHVGDVLPRTWVNVRRALENDTRATVTQQEFLNLCEENGFTRPEDALQLSSYLHDLGVILHFRNDPLLKYTVILKPEWGTEAVYRILDNERVKANFGFFSRADLRGIWYEEEYILLHDELLALMMKFQLCYAIPNQKDRYIVPQLLIEQPPDYELTANGADRAKKALYLRYKYEAFMPKGLLTRFIVVMHPHIATDGEKQFVWRTGVVLEKNETRAEIIEFYHRREIRIRVAGENMRDFLAIISYQLDELHRPFHRLEYDKLVPCNCEVCNSSENPNSYPQKTLQRFQQDNQPKIMCNTSYQMVNVQSLLDDVGAAVQTAELSTLLRTLNRDFNDDEFRTLCLELGMNYDNLPGEGLEGKQREFLLKLERNGRLPELINLLRQKRPNFNW